VTEPGRAGDFAGKALVVTGGGSGIGEATARMFTERGGRTAIIDYRVDAAARVADELPGACAVLADVSEEDSVRRAVAEAHAHLGRVDCVVNAAGHHVPGRLEEWSYAEWTRMLAVHAGGTFLMCRETLPLLRANGGGSIVNIASVAAFVAQSANAPYGAAKGAILAFSRQLAAEVAPEVRVNVVAPGRIRTAMTEPLIVERGGGDVERGLEVTRAMNPMQRIGEPWELAEVICFLLSGRTPYVTGASFLIDGGETAI
jgi:3-oxoacyl-[acyl-carrier protein] reductase